MSLKAIVLFAFFSGLLLVPGVQRLFSGRKKFLAERLKQLAGPGKPGENGRIVDRRPKPVSFKALLARAGLLSPQAIRAAADRRLAEADLPLKGEEFVALTALCAAGGCVLTAAVGGRPVAVGLAGLIGGILPSWFVGFAARKRTARLNGQIADTLMIMANSLRAGFGFLQAIEVVQREMPPPIGREFGRTFREMSLGTPVEEALAGLVQRVKSEDLALVVTAVLVQRQVGGNLAEVLDKIAHTIRERVRIQGEIRTLTAQGRISGLMIGLLPVFLLVVMMAMNPDYVGLLFTHPAGKVMLAAAAGSEIVGWILIRRIVNITV